MRPDGAAAGRFVLDGGPDGATARATDAAPDLVLGVADLGAISLGGVTASGSAGPAASPSRPRVRCWPPTACSRPTGRRTPSPGSRSAGRRTGSGGVDPRSAGSDTFGCLLCLSAAVRRAPGRASLRALAVGMASPGRDARGRDALVRRRWRHRRRRARRPSPVRRGDPPAAGPARPAVPVAPAPRSPSSATRSPTRRRPRSLGQLRPPLADQPDDRDVPDDGTVRLPATRSPRTCSRTDPACWCSSSPGTRERRAWRDAAGELLRDRLDPPGATAISTTCAGCSPSRSRPTPGRLGDRAAAVTDAVLVQLPARARGRDPQVSPATTAASGGRHRRRAHHRRARLRAHAAVPARRGSAYCRDGRLVVRDRTTASTSTATACRRRSARASGTPPAPVASARRSPTPPPTRADRRSSAPALARALHHAERPGRPAEAVHHQLVDLVAVAMPSFTTFCASATIAK